MGCCASHPEDEDGSTESQPEIRVVTTLSLRDKQPSKSALKKSPHTDGRKVSWAEPGSVPSTTATATATATATTAVVVAPGPSSQDSTEEPVQPFFGAQMSSDEFGGSVRNDGAAVQQTESSPLGRLEDTGGGGATAAPNPLVPVGPQAS